MQGGKVWGKERGKSHEKCPFKEKKNQAVPTLTTEFSASYVYLILKRCAEFPVLAAHSAVKCPPDQLICYIGTNIHKWETKAVISKNALKYFSFHSMQNPASPYIIHISLLPKQGYNPTKTGSLPEKKCTALSSLALVSSHVTVLLT